ncbi:FCSD flavin-binding domain-containing protein [Thiomonas bhubaneswarensis]|uniref:Sulfide dehydrogenase (Flavocytochrome c), flavoprotein subunit n=1 Tax=Thiomonas bhubaneswarensis TaxID=339866 RepID=A0A0K6ICM9_9BURK|nr:FCSD flavin-binding domain-containing protein [Thiomonas bhubaneswarensis]CUB00865.1 sulfide dehydrogenase (flavocytochrome c), flavoprotein subunit [Thiomonas bhubaneswarensis]
MPSRRNFLAGAASVGAIGLAPVLSGCASTTRSAAGKGKVVIVGAGYGGSTAAKYIREWSGNTIEVTVVEPGDAFISCPISNLVIAGAKSMQDITTSYDALRTRHGVKWIKSMVESIDPAAHTVKLANGETLKYDKLVLSPGIDLMFDTVEGLKAANEAGQILISMKAGPETMALRKQIEAMPDGGVFALSVPKAPFRCPPGPYERATLVAAYFKQHKPKSKVLIFDANDKVQSKEPLFKKAWAEQYKGMIEYIPDHNVTGVNAQSKEVLFEVDNPVKADVLNIIPQQRAGVIAQKTGLANMNARWCAVDYKTFESAVHKDIHVLGDSIQISPLMPKSGHMANQHAKVAAAAIVSMLYDQPVNPHPVVMNTCYSMVSFKEAIHVATVHQYDEKEKTYLTVPGSGGISAGLSELEAHYAEAWATNIWRDTLS